MKAELTGIEVLAAEEARPAPLAPPTLKDSAAQAGARAVEPAVDARRNPRHGSTAEAAQPAEALALTRAALQTSRQAATVAQELVACMMEMGAAPEDATRAADHIQAEAEALGALGQRLVRLAQALHATAEGLRPSQERRRAALAENLQCFKAQHLALAQRAEAMLAGSGALSPHQLVSADACELGQWQAGARESGWEKLPAFQALERPHKAFHRALAGLLFAHQQRRTETAIMLLAELQARAVAMADHLDALCAGILAPNDTGGGEVVAAG